MALVCLHLISSQLLLDQPVPFVKSYEPHTNGIYSILYIFIQSKYKTDFFTLPLFLLMESIPDIERYLQRQQNRKIFEERGIQLMPKLSTDRWPEKGGGRASTQLSRAGSSFCPKFLPYRNLAPQSLRSPSLLYTTQTFHQFQR